METLPEIDTVILFETPFTKGPVERMKIKEYGEDFVLLEFLDQERPPYKARLSTFKESLEAAAKLA